MEKWKKYVHKLIFFIFCGFISLNSFSTEYNIEVFTILNSETTPAEANYQLKINGFEQAIKQKLEAEGFSKKLFDEKVLEKNFSTEKYYEFLKSFFVKEELIFVAGTDAKAGSGLPRKAIFSGTINDSDFKEKFIDLTENMGLHKNKNFYIELNLDLLGGLSWTDFGISNESSMNSSISNFWKDYYLEHFKDFKNIISVDELVKPILKNRYSNFSSDSVLQKVNVSVKKISENKSSKKITLLIEGNFILLGIKENSVLVSFDFIPVKKELSLKNQKELSSTIGTLIFNMIKYQTKSIDTSLSFKKTKLENTFLLKGQELFSDIYSAQRVLEEYFSKDSIKVSIKKINLVQTDLIISGPLTNEVVVEKLKSLGEKPISNDPKEQKVLIFDAANNSFAITQKDKIILNKEPIPQ
jgi:hypothetical protein